MDPTLDILDDVSVSTKPDRSLRGHSVVLAVLCALFSLGLASAHSMQGTDPCRTSSSVPP